MKRIFSALFSALIFVACESEYTKLVRSELARNITMDSLVFNVRFGDTKKEFYDHCWQLNKKGLITNGPKNAMVQYIFIDSIFHREPTSIRFLFYGDFDETGRIKGMDCEFGYPGWSPWNTRYSADSLQSKVVRIVQKWYGGNQFIKVHFDDTQNLWVKVDGNRRIVVKKINQQDVSMSIHNLLHDDYRHSNL